jgi:putative membrane protein
MNIVAGLPLLTHEAGDWGHGWWPLWPLFWAALIGIAIWLVLRRRDRRGPFDQARGVLAERFARGELSAEEYRERLNELQQSSRGQRSDA